MDHRIIGTSMPVLEFVLQPGERVLAQGGELSWKSGSIQMRQATRAAGAQGLVGLAKRMAGGGSLFMTEYFADDEAGLLAFATKVPGQILPLELNVGKGYLVHRSGFLCGTDGVELSAGFSQSMGVGLFGGTGFVFQRIAGSGTAWIELDGEVVTYELDRGEILEVAPGHVGLFEESIGVSLTTIRGFKNMLFGGDGIFLVRLTGPGKVWLQSLPLAHLAGALAPYLHAGSETPTDRAVDSGVSVAAAGIGLLTSGLVGSGVPGPTSLMDRVKANSAPDSVEARAFLPNGGADVASAWSAPDPSSIGAALGVGGSPVDLAGSATDALGALMGSAPDQLPDIPVDGSDALSSAADAASNAAPDMAGSILNVVSGLFNFGSDNS